MFSSLPASPSSGYVQGMSDLCAPILDILEDEVEAFWCFAGFLDIVVSRVWLVSCTSDVVHL